MLDQCLHPQVVNVAVIDRRTRVLLIHEGGRGKLPEIIDAARLASFALGPRQCWQQHTRQDRNNRNHDEQLD